MKKIEKLFKPFHQESFKKSILGEEQTLIVFDSNYLLEILKNDVDTAEEYIKAIKKYKENVYIPYFVGLEFHFNKSSCNAAKEATFNAYLDKIKDLQNSDTLDIFSKDSKNTLKRDHEKLKKHFDNCLLNERKQKDRLYKQILNLLEDTIGDKPEQTFIDETQEKGEKRFEEGCPPGFNDNDKSIVRKYDELTYKTKFGDLLIWKDIIQEVNKQNKEKLVFVTNDGQSDKKNDLLYKQKGRTIGPHIALMNELNTKASAELYIINNNKFVSDISGSNIQSKSNMSYLMKDSTALDFDMYKKYKEDTLPEESFKVERRLHYYKSKLSRYRDRYITALSQENPSSEEIMFYRRRMRDLRRKIDMLKIDLEKWNIDDDDN